MIKKNINAILNINFELSTNPSNINKARSFNNSIAKRLLDYVITIPGFLVLLPFLILVAIAIKIDSPGPIIFKQKRVGKDGKIFDMYKFRSMKQNADQDLHRQHILSYVDGKNDKGSTAKLEHDPRVTKLGRFLRSLDIDELPQLVNVLKGDMSLVGPRPVPIYETEQYNLWQSERLSTLPGITGLWQVSGRSWVSFEEQLRLDIRYIRNQSFWLNIKIILRTAYVVLSREGAEHKN